MSHQHTTRNPMSEARRNAVHGPLLPADDPERLTRTDITAISVMLGGLLIVVTVIIGGM